MNEKWFDIYEGVAHLMTVYNIFGTRILMKKNTRLFNGLEDVVVL
ncbi:hypothetical protein NUACC26_086700 [Scytonema sp. NUACC26]